MAEIRTQNKCAREVARLKQELKTERLRGDLWQKVVEVAEEELGIAGQSIAPRLIIRDQGTQYVLWPSRNRWDWIANSDYSDP